MLSSPCLSLYSIVICISVNSVIFCFTGYNPLLSLFSLWLKLSLCPSGAISTYFLSPFYMHLLFICFCFCFLACPHFLALDLPGSLCTYFLPQPCSQPFLQGVLVPFIGEWYLETKIWVLGAHCYWGVTPSTPSLSSLFPSFLPSLLLFFPSFSSCSPSLPLLFPSFLHLFPLFFLPPFHEDRPLSLLLPANSPAP